MARKKKKRIRRVDKEGIAHIYATFNNTIVTITDKQGNCVAWSSSGQIGYKGAKKGTPFAAGLCAKRCGKTVEALGMRDIEVWIKGPGPGRDAAVRALKACGLNITLIKDVTPIPHDGCRPPKRRRV
ncbi:MAG TPA: 30S ribosomal protein S11 [bacterium (Candidatus Stahlbacteria)]|nr:30S ribosomal protein S11 [Candidatus Stahlbacteria bacterium]